MASTKRKRRLLAVFLILILAAAGCASPAAQDDTTGGEPSRTPLEGATLTLLPLPPPTTSTTLAFPDAPAAETPGGFSAVSAGWGYTCGLRSDGEAECWRWGEAGSEPGEDIIWDFEWEKNLLNLDWDPSPQAAEPPKGAFVAVTAGRESACGLRPTGRVECWGNNQALSNPPDGVFVAVSAGIEHACALQPTGRAQCWGSSTPRGNATLPPKEEYTDIAAADTFTCGIRKNDRTAECWGNGFTRDNDHPESGLGVIPPGEFTTITAGDSDVCGMRANGTVECWANYSPDYGPYLTPTPEREFASISLSNRGVPCGMHPDGEHECWGVNGLVLPVARGDWAAVVGGCGALRGGGVECWDLSNWTVGEELPETTRVDEGEYIKLTNVLYSHTCGLRPGGGVECWSWVGDHPITETPESVFTDITSGRDHACGLRPDWSVECWGSDSYGETLPPQGAFTKVSASADFTCGLRPTGGIECWGDPYAHSKITPPQAPLTSVSAGWGGYQWIYGAPHTGHVTPPPPSPASIENDWGYSCGLRPDRTPKCWGDPADRFRKHPGWPQVLNPPPGEFTEVQAGRRGACGLRSDGKIECWGNYPHTSSVTILEGDYTMAGVYPENIRIDGPETYTALSVGGTHTCGLLPNGDIECWEDTGKGILHERGPFTAVSAGYDHQCGLLTTGNIRCWTKNDLDTTNWKTQTYTPTPQ